MDAEIVVGQLYFMKKVFRKFTRKHLYWSPFLIKRLCYRCFGVNFENLKTPVLQNLCEWLLLWMLIIVQLASYFQVFNYNNYSKYLIIMFLKIQFNPLYQYANNFILFIVTQIVNVLRANFCRFDDRKVTKNLNMFQFYYLSSNVFQVPRHVSYFLYYQACITI